MSEISAVAEWLRQRKDETDEAWIERLLTVFVPIEDANANRVGERAWKRFVARHETRKAAK